MKNYWLMLKEGEFLKKGMNGDHIKELQKDIELLGANPGFIDGNFGDKTEEAVKIIQKNWLINGVVDKDLAERIRRNAQVIEAKKPIEKKKIITPNKFKIQKSLTSVNYSSRRGYKPYMIVYHYTGMYGHISDKTPRSIGVFKNSRARVSAHYVIGFDGSIWLVVPEEYNAWHAGRSRHKGLPNCNWVSIGIEIENFGYLLKAGNKFYHSAGTRYPYQGALREECGEPVYKPQWGHNYWMPYSERQIKASIWLGKQIQKRYGIKKEDIVGHSDISRRLTGKVDPGPAFPMQLVKEKIYS